MNLEKALHHKIFKTVSKTGTSLGFDTYVIGGYVRDFLLERDFKKDIDFVTTGSGIKLAEEVSINLPEKPHVSVFKNFGTAMLKVEGIDIEFVSARKESYNENRRKPSVENGTLQDDQNRRDFTINALAISLNKETYGELLDPFNGISDLENKIIRTPLSPDIT